MHKSKFRQALQKLMAQHPPLAREIRAALREEREVRRTASVDRHYLVWQSLKKLEELAPQALELVREHPEELEPWHEHQINVAAEYLEAAVDALRCKAEHEVSPYVPEQSFANSDDVVFDDEPSPEVAEDNLEIEDFE